MFVINTSEFGTTEVLPLLKVLFPCQNLFDFSYALWLRLTKAELYNRSATNCPIQATMRINLAILVAYRQISRRMLE